MKLIIVANRDVARVRLWSPPGVGVIGWRAAWACLAVVIGLLVSSALVVVARPPNAPPRCPHQPDGCCRHNLLRFAPVPEGPCTPDCLRRTNRCVVPTPGGSVGIRV